MLHVNELPLRHLIIDIDGPTTSSDGFTGPIGKLLKNIHDLPLNESFNAMSGGEDLIHIPDDIVKTLNTCQHNCHLLVKAIKNGEMSKEFAGLKCGPINHSRWLTTVRLHRCSGQESMDLLESYFKVYFGIKLKHGLLDGPNHVVTALRILKISLRKFKFKI